MSVFKAYKVISFSANLRPLNYTLTILSYFGCFSTTTSFLFRPNNLFFPTHFFFTKLTCICHSQLCASITSSQELFLLAKFGFSASVVYSCGSPSSFHTVLISFLLTCLPHGSLSECGKSAIHTVSFLESKQKLALNKYLLNIRAGIVSSTSLVVIIGPQKYL